ncbi:MAG: hypothetical protein ACD_79C00251G0005 [uncultured bacterium]|nr:MAG: hypothetical protein ACD_79C00251G0005 [uncultured bacterium]
MKTYYLKKEDVVEKWYLVDAANQIVGRVAGKIACILRGKNNPDFTPAVECKNVVVVINSEKVKISGKKAEDKNYFHHTFFIGGLKKISYERMMETHPDRILEHAIKGMLPKNKLQDRMMARLKIYKGDKHPHSAQKLEKVN